MRIWDVPVQDLCRKHLLGEHRELHAIWSILLHGKKGYRNHPETQRWIWHLDKLKRRHDSQVREMERRGYSHRSPLIENPLYCEPWAPEKLHSIDEQIELLKAKPCPCYQGE